MVTSRKGFFFAARNNARLQNWPAARPTLPKVSAKQKAKPKRKRESARATAAAKTKAAAKPKATSNRAKKAES